MNISSPISKLSILAFMSFTLLLFGYGITTLAQDEKLCDDPAVSNSNFCQDFKTGGSNPNDNRLVGPNGVLTNLVRVVSIIVGAVSVLVLVIGGMYFVTSGGDPQKVKRARDTVIYAMVGVLVAIFAGFIIGWVLSRI